ncbi:hypothetical protein [Neptunomonas sp. XY-337]|uniref:hypothetical protein n=1 Tax=Neptunomonas sp. XY-337 TaxID=2561897 RepID=UPI0010AAF3C5|nr:hypothetical protein [Neptunomonas sp. XY-337]
MLLEEDIKTYFNHFNLPEKFLSLVEFDRNIAKGERFSEGFELSLQTDKFGLKTYSGNEEFLNSIYEFSLADGTGSTYAFWVKNGESNLAEMPIIAFGSEGGFHVVANNFDEFLQILTFDSEPMIDWDSINYFKSPEYDEPSARVEDYINWLKSACNLLPISDANSIVENAQKNHKDSLQKWFNKFYNH